MLAINDIADFIDRQLVLLYCERWMNQFSAILPAKL